MWAKAQDRMNELDVKMIEDLFQVEEKKSATDLGRYVVRFYEGFEFRLKGKEFVETVIVFRELRFPLSG